MRIRLLDRRLDPPAADVALSAVVLRRVAGGVDPPTLRLWSPAETVAFGRQDTVRPEFTAAAEAARECGFAPVVRNVGGRAAVLHPGAIAFELSLPHHRGLETIADRFEATARSIADALRRLGADPRVGEVPGEYCPGRWSVNLGGTRKVAGVAQRLVAGGVQIGAVVMVSGAESTNEVLEPVYRALGYRWRPEATGAIDRDLPGVGADEVAGALLDTWVAEGWVPDPAELDDSLVEEARRTAPQHAIPR
ncbi:MAG: lipoate--protein ligase family protein [Acidimicrobiia bacterium]|nr:MAG: lipoate--protein ligase family protein [Acidimicrobiia bacterium]